MVIQSAISAPLQHFPLGSHTSLVIRTLPLHKHPISSSISEFHSYGATLNHERRKPTNCKFRRRKLSLQDLNSKKMIGGGYEPDGLYYLEQHPSLNKSMAFQATVSLHQWHCRLGHPSLQSLKLVFPSFKSVSTLECEACQLGASLDVDVLAPSTSIPLPILPPPSSQLLQVYRRREKPPRTVDPLAPPPSSSTSVEVPTPDVRKEILPIFLTNEDLSSVKRPLIFISAFSSGAISWLTSAKMAQASGDFNVVYEIGELFELGIQLSYLLLLLGLLGVGSFFVIRQVLVRRELDLSAKELQEQVRSGDASATELFELGAVMLRRKVYPAATKYLLQAVEKWDGDDQDLAQVYNALGVSYIRDGKLEKGIDQLENAVKLQPGYVTAWNNLGDAYEKNKDLKSALKAFEEVLLFDPNNKVARPRRDAMKEKVQMYKGVSLKPKQR